MHNGKNLKSKATREKAFQTTLRFPASALATVIAEVEENCCDLLLVKDEGVYVMAEKGLLQQGKRQIAYADGFDPATAADAGEFYDMVRTACGGDDFCDHLTLTPQLLDVLRSVAADLVIELTPTSFTVSAEAIDNGGAIHQFAAPTGEIYQYNDDSIFCREADGLWHFMMWHRINKPTPEMVWQRICATRNSGEQ
jgi:hypothetical protein